ncbi:MAG: hypothetical protein QXE05_04980 [Nitrososphaeria archaeon]
MKEKLCLEKPQYMVRVYRKTVSFLWSCEPGKILESSVDLKVKARLPEIFKVAEELGCTTVGSKIFPVDLDAYNRLMIYATVRPKVRSLHGLRMLRNLVKEINGYDAHYWAAEVREVWWRHRNYRSLLRVIKAFKLFFGL